jgi:kynurenine formamidase
MKYLNLSHPLSTDLYLPPPLPPVQAEQRGSIERGDGANWFVVTFCNHAATHVDAPRHFVRDGVAIGDFDIGEFVFERVCCVSVSLGDGALIEPVHLAPCATTLTQSDLLLIQTGFSAVRQVDQKRYVEYSPGLSIATGHFLRDKFPALRAIGLESFMVGSMQYASDAAELHHILLEGLGRRFLIFEDMNLGQDLAGLKQVIALPLLFRELDSSPCTVLGITG